MFDFLKKKETAAPVSAPAVDISNFEYFFNAVEGKCVARYYIHGAKNAEGMHESLPKVEATAFAAKTKQEAMEKAYAWLATVKAVQGA